MVTMLYPQVTFGVDAASSASEAGATPKPVVTTPAPTPAPTQAPAPTTQATQKPAVSSQVKTVTKPVITNVPLIGKLYTVVSGDKLWKIAQAFNLSLDEILALNPQIKNPNLLYVGQKIVVGKDTTTTVVAAPAPSAPAKSIKIYQGLGHSVAFRNGPGTDSEGVPVYSFNIVLAQVTFDADGKILSVYMDGYEVSTPNYDGASMPHFSGWPNKEGYNITDHESGKVSGISVNTPESAAAEVKGWKTKRERGDEYEMNPSNEWYKQMDFYQKFFVGKTIPELEAWFAKYTTAAGRPIKSTTTNQDDLNKLAKLTDKEKAELADVVSGATMSLRDPHGDFLGALANAYANRVELEIPVK